jgi:ABC-type sugar transport system ATPase subunit
MAETGPTQLVQEMIGRDLREMYPRRRSTPGAVRVEFAGVTVPGICEDVSLRVRVGEIVAAFGLVGSGATELPYIAAGEHRGSGVSTAGTSGLVPADRRLEGVFPGSTVQRNLSVATLARYARRRVFRRDLERQAAVRQIDALGIRPERPALSVSALSGGNQQKTVVGRWLEKGVDLLLLSEPTRGVDVGARSEIYRILAERCTAGAAVFLASSDLDEVVGLADRVVVMSRGRVAAELSGSEITAERLLEAATR